MPFQREDSEYQWKHKDRMLSEVKHMAKLTFSRFKQ